MDNGAGSHPYGNGQENLMSGPTDPGLRPGRADALLAQATRFLGSGLLLFPLGLGVSAFLNRIVGLVPEVASAIAIVVMLLAGFALTRVYVFRASGAMRRQFPRFLLVSVTMRGAEYVMFLLWLRLAGLGNLPSLTLALATSSLMKFFFYRNWVFGRSLLDAAGRPGA